MSEITNYDTSYELHGGTYKAIDMEKYNRLYDQGVIDYNDWIKMYKMTPEWQLKRALANGRIERRRNKDSSKGDV